MWNSSTGKHFSFFFRIWIEKNENSCALPCIHRQLYATECRGMCAKVIVWTKPFRTIFSQSIAICSSENTVNIIVSADIVEETTFCDGKIHIFGQYLSTTLLWSLLKNNLAAMLCVHGKHKSKILISCIVWILRVKMILFIICNVLDLGF